jgi:hypothetical protein
MLQRQLCNTRLAIGEGERCLVPAVEAMAALDN